MISRIRGTLIERDLDRVEVLTAGGLVYELEIPTSAFQKLPDVGEEAELLTKLIVREDSHTLFGFADARDRTMFNRLMTVKGLGPRLALAVLSTYSTDRLARALVEKDSRLLSQVSGIGKKTAERMVLELSDKVGDLAVAAPAGETWTAQSHGYGAATAALVGLGYSQMEADQAVRLVMDEEAPETTAELIRLVLARRTIPVK